MGVPQPMPQELSGVAPSLGTQSVPFSECETGWEGRGGGALCTRKASQLRKAFPYTDPPYQILEGHRGGSHAGPGYKSLHLRGMCGTCLVLFFFYKFAISHQPVHSDVGRKFLSGSTTLLEGGRLRRRKVMIGATRHIHTSFTKA